MDISHLVQKFVDEVTDLLAGLENDLLELESNPDSKGNIDQVFRKMHTIKGASGMYGFENIMEITHELETIYDLIRNGKHKISKQLIDLTLGVGDHVKNLLLDKKTEIETNRSNHVILKDALSKFRFHEPEYHHIKPEFHNHDGKKTFQILFYPDDSLLMRGINLTYIIEDLGTLGYCEIDCVKENNVIAFWVIYIVTDKGISELEDIMLFVSDYCNIHKLADFDIFNEQEFKEYITYLQGLEKNYGKSNDEKEITLSEIKINPNTTSGKLNSSQRINVDAAKLDRLMYLVTELVTTKSQLILAIQEKKYESIIEASEKIEKLSKYFSNNALSIRLVSLHEMLLKFQRLIRDLSNQLGKKISFSIKGDETELDKNIVDALAEPVMHLIRNCIDHGIEHPEKRREKGKDETGIIFFNAYKSGNNVFVEIGDDGTGIDMEYVYSKAVDQGFIQAGTQLDEKGIYDLIFLPGFSTARSLTDISGRGVGMDIVLKRIHDIRGEVFVKSKRDAGTTFTIKLQQTISIIDTLLITADSSVFAIPIEDIEACDIEFHINIFRRQNNLIEYNNELIPYLYLREKFHAISQAPEKEKLIIINKQGRKYIIVADKILGQHQAAVKPLSQSNSMAGYLSGASILGDGSIALLLDTDKIKELM